MTQIDEWEAPERLPDSPELHLSGFDGPMDLLLELAERQRIDLGAISVLQLAEQFLAGMSRLEGSVALERRAEWLAMAARLVLLRSRLMFPHSPADAAVAAREAEQATAWLERLAAVRDGAAWLVDRAQLGIEVFVRAPGRSARVVSYMALMEACLAVLRGAAGPAGAEGVYRPGETLLFRVDDAIGRVRAAVAGQEAVAFARCLPAVGRADPRRALKARSAVASSLVAVLELTRGGEVVAWQAEGAGAIWVAGVA